MCDTFVATPNATKDKIMIFGKNSDREPNEAQNVTFVPAGKHKIGSTVSCTYIEVPQVERTNAVLLSRPFWMFGAEMGVNEHGVVIGNEAVFTKEKYSKKNVLTGMDILRLALERSKSADEAKDTIISLIVEYGQGGNCSMDGKLFYHNSFIIADHLKALVLETAGKHWVLKEVDTVTSISNCLTIGDDFDVSSEGLREYAIKKGYCRKDEEFNFRNIFSDSLYTHFAKGKKRRECSFSQLYNKTGSIETTDVMGILRDHNVKGEFIVGKNPMESICLHGGGLISSQTTGSMVVALRKGASPLIYITGTSAPCLSLFKPHTLLPNQESIAFNDFSKEQDNRVVEVYGSAGITYDNSTLWWRGEDIHRQIIFNYPVMSKDWISSIADKEREMIKVIEKKWIETKTAEFEKECITAINEMIAFYKKNADNFISNIGKKKTKSNMSLISKQQWKKWNKKAKIIL